MAIKTTRHHVTQALRFYEAPGKYFGIGRTTPWANENAPPANDPDVTGLDEPIGYKPLGTLQFMVPDPAGEFEYQGSIWRAVATENAIAEGAFHLYVTTTLNPADLPVDVSYREIAVFSGLQPIPGAGAGSLLHAQVADVGVIEVVDRRSPVYRAPGQDETLSLMLRF